MTTPVKVKEVAPAPVLVVGKKTRAARVARAPAGGKETGLGSRPAEDASSTYGRYKDPEARRAYMRDLMRKRREEEK